MVGLLGDKGAIRAADVGHHAIGASLLRYSASSTIACSDHAIQFSECWGIGPGGGAVRLNHKTGHQGEHLLRARQCIWRSQPFLERSDDMFPGDPRTIPLASASAKARTSMTVMRVLLFSAMRRAIVSPKPVFSRVNTLLVWMTCSSVCSKSWVLAPKFSPLTIDGTAKVLVSSMVGGFPGLSPKTDNENVEMLLYVGVKPMVSHGHNTGKMNRKGGVWFQPGFITQFDSFELPVLDNPFTSGPPTMPDVSGIIGDWPCAALPGKWVDAHVERMGGWKLAPPALVAFWHELRREDEAAQGVPAVAMLLISRRQRRKLNAVLSFLGSPADIILNPIDAEGYGIAHGDKVRVSTARGEICLTANVSDTIRQGVASIPHRHEVANVNCLTSAENVHKMTGMVLYTGIPITIAPTAA